MTPQEKAKELISNYEKILKLDYENYYKYNFEHCRKCALICVDEMLSLRYLLKKETWFYKEVKKEIEKL